MAVTNMDSPWRERAAQRADAETPPKALWAHSGPMRFFLPMNAHKVAAGIIALGLILGYASAAHAIAKEGSTVAREAGASERAADAVVGPLLRIKPGPPTALQHAQGEELTGDMLLIAAVVAVIPFGYFYGGLWLVRGFQRGRLAAVPEHSVPAADATAAQGRTECGSEAAG